MDTPKKIGRYEVIEELGRGAMGTVYRAKDPAMDRVVAVKTIISAVLDSQQGNEFRERFYREARAAGALAHPGIVPVFDVGEHEGVPFLVMEFVTGRTLAEAVRKGERPTLDRVCEVGQKVAEALGYAHQKGVVHRDIKPANILLTSREAYGIERPKITDFGVAKLAEGQTTLTGQILGTPAFMPPEQFTGAPVDGRADLFSLGVVLYWMATGEQPFPGESMTAVSYKVVHTEPVPPRKLNPSLPPKLENIILKCLAKDPGERYQTGEELARDLDELRGGTKSAVLNSHAGAAQVNPAVGDPDATVVDATGMGPRLTSAPAASAAGSTTPKSAQSTPTGKPRDNRLALAAIIVAALAIGGWFVLRSRAKPISAETASSSTMPNLPPAPEPAGAIASGASNGSDRAAAPATSAVPAAPSNAPPTGTEGNKEKAREEASAPAKTAARSALPSALGFNPRTLDPKENAKLKIDAAYMPPGLNFTVEMNGKIYLQKASAGDPPESEDLFVPPGVQEFRVVARSGAVEKISNTVSTEFKAKKRKTLKIELRTKGSAEGQGVPQGLYPDTQIVVSLK